jgi:hypothetical protein
MGASQLEIPTLEPLNRSTMARQRRSPLQNERSMLMSNLKQKAYNHMVKRKEKRHKEPMGTAFIKELQMGLLGRVDKAGFELVQSQQLPRANSTGGFSEDSVGMWKDQSKLGSFKSSFDREMVNRLIG